MFNLWRLSITSLFFNDSKEVSKNHFSGCNLMGIKKKKKKKGGIRNFACKLEKWQIIIINITFVNINSKIMLRVFQRKGQNVFLVFYFQSEQKGIFLPFYFRSPLTLIICICLKREANRSLAYSKSLQIVRYFFICRKKERNFSDQESNSIVFEKRKKKIRFRRCKQGKREKHKKRGEGRFGRHFCSFLFIQRPFFLFRFSPHQPLLNTQSFHISFY